MKIVTHNFLCAEATAGELELLLYYFLKRRTRDTDGNAHHGQVHFSFFPCAFVSSAHGDAEYT
jgi:hypothetical protein